MSPERPPHLTFCWLCRQRLLVPVVSISHRRQSDGWSRSFSLCRHCGGWLLRQVHKSKGALA